MKTLKKSDTPQKTQTPTPGKTMLSMQFPQDLMEQVETTSNALGMSVEDTVRLATRCGLEDIRKINYDIAQLIIEAVHHKTITL